MLASAWPEFSHQLCEVLCGSRLPWAVLDELFGAAWMRVTYSLWRPGLPSVGKTE